MADNAIAKARANLAAAEKTLADHNLGLVQRAQATLAKMQPLADELAAIAAEMDPSNGQQNLGLLVSMVASVATVLGHEAELHGRTLARLAEPQA